MDLKRGIWPWISLLALVVLLPACSALAGDDSVQVTVVEPTPVIAATPTQPAMPVEELEPTPEPPGWLAELASASSTYDLPGQIFLLDGPNVLLVDGEASIEQITEGIRVRHVASSPDGSRAAVVQLTDVGTRTAEEIRLLDARGGLSEPLSGPEVVSGPAANPRITALNWSPDGSRLAVTRNDGSVWIVNADGSGESRQIVEASEVDSVVWSANGAAIAALVRDSAGAPGRILIVQVDGEEQTTIEPLRSFGGVEWLKGSGRLAVVEEWTKQVNPHAGSIFTVSPEESELELLVSAGGFAPRVDVPLLSGSPDGRWLAFAVHTPGAGGELSFLSLWLLELESGLLRQVDVPRGYQVSDLWWSSAGLVWRAVLSNWNWIYTGVEPYTLGVYDLAEGRSSVIYSSDGS